MGNPFQLKTQIKPVTEVEGEEPLSLDPTSIDAKIITAEDLADQFGKITDEVDKLQEALVADPRALKLMKLQKEQTRLQASLLEKVSTPKNLGEKLLKCHGLTSSGQERDPHPRAPLLLRRGLWQV